MKTAQHERIEIVSDDEVRIGRNVGANTLFQISEDELLELSGIGANTSAKWDAAGLEALTLCTNCFRQTGSFKALRDGEVALFVGGKVRDLTGNTQSILLIQKERCWLTTLEWTNKNDMLPLVVVSPKVRPYTPREAVEFLGRAMIFSKYPKGTYALVEVGLKHALVAGDMGYETYEALAEHFTWADTGEKCGVVEKEDICIPKP